MRRHCLYLASLLCVLDSTLLAYARQSGETQLVQSWFQKYLKRRADPPSLQQFASQLQQGVQQTEIQGTILGSDEFFNRYGRRNEEFVRGLYADALDRKASNAETKLWMDRLREVNGNRTELAKRFLRSAENEQVTGGLKPIDLVRLWFQKYLGREVDQSGVDRYVGLLRQGASPLDCQAELLGSDEYYNRRGGNLDGFISGLFQDIMGRAPTGRDLRSWRTTFTQLGGNRQILARQFLGQAGVQVENSTPPLPPPVLPPGAHGDLITQIIRATERFNSMCQAEIPGTGQGRQCILRSQALQSGLVNLQNQLAGNLPPNIVVGTFNGVERAYGALREQLARPPGTAPNSSQIADQIGVLIANLKNLPPFNGTTPGPPIAPPPANLGYDPNLVLNLLNGVLGDTSRLLRTMGGGQTFAFQSLRRDIEGFVRQVQGLHSQVERGEPLPTVQNVMVGIQRFGLGISEKMRNPSVPTLWRQSWVSIDRQQSRVAGALQLNPAGPPPSPGTPPAVPSKLINAVDSLTAEIDAYLASIAPLMAFNPQYFPMQAQFVAMRAVLLEMRQIVASGAIPDAYRPQFVQIDQLFRQISAIYDGMRAANPAPPSLAKVSRRFDEVARAMPR